MITISGTRDRGGEVFKDCPAAHDVGLVEAMEFLLKHELGFGGRIVEVSKVLIRTETHVLSCVDSTSFSGPESEMVKLLWAAGVYVQLCSGEERVDADLTRFLELTGGVALLVTAFGGVPHELVGRRYSEVAAAVVVGGADAPTLLREGEDFWTLLRMYVEDGRGVLSLVA